MACSNHLSQIQVRDPHHRAANQQFLQMSGFLHDSQNLLLLLLSFPIICSSNISVPVPPSLLALLSSPSLLHIYPPPPAASHLLNAPRWPPLRQLSSGTFQRSRCAGRMRGGRAARVFRAGGASAGCWAQSRQFQIMSGLQYSRFCYLRQKKINKGCPLDRRFE